MQIKYETHFRNIGEARDKCYLCSQFYDDQPDGEGGDETIYGGRLHLKDSLIEHEGQYYCPEHFEFRFNRKLREENIIDIEEIDSTPEI